MFEDEGYGTGNSFSSEDYGGDDDNDHFGEEGEKGDAYGKDDGVKRVDDMEYEEAAYWERMGREYMDTLNKERAEACTCA